jgi:hypothetical protein
MGEVCSTLLSVAELCEDQTLPLALYPKAYVSHHFPSEE